MKRQFILLNSFEFGMEETFLFKGNVGIALKEGLVFLAITENAIQPDHLYWLSSIPSFLNVVELLISEYYI